MSKEPLFSSTYSSHYDLFYGDKNYDRECDLIESAFERFSRGKVAYIVDMGCGTGNHAIRLAKRGYAVTGIDQSGAMVALARAKTERAGGMFPNGPPGFLVGDIRTVEPARVFDAAVMMFAVLGYQKTNEDVLEALGNAARHVREGGLLVFDVWYGPGVIVVRPTERVKVIPTADGRLIRASSGRLDVAAHICEVNYRLWRLSGDHLVDETEETHLVRFFFLRELELFLDCAGFDLVHASAFGDLDQRLEDTTWNTLIVSRKQARHGDERP